MTGPLVSVITPTWQRHAHLTTRCIPSVAAQTYRLIEHVVVSDGPDPELAALIAERTTGRLYCTEGHEGLPFTYAELPEHEVVIHWGGPARRRGTELAQGEYIAYLDDDDAYRPQHCQVLADALDANPDAGFAWSQMLSHDTNGTDTPIRGPLGNGGIGTPMLMHRREILELATWGQPSALEDWELVAAWLAAGVGHVPVPEETVDVWPSGAWAGM